MNWIDIPTEQTTSVTDLLLCLLTLVLGIVLYRARYTDRVKAGVWCIAFFSLSLASFLGFVAHGFEMSEATNRMFWHPLNFLLGMTIAFIGLGIVYDLWKNIPRALYYVAVVVAVGFFMVTIVWPDSFFVFILYEAGVLAFGLVAYTILLVRKYAGAALVLIGLLLTIMAAVIQATKLVQLDLVWTFDHNGIFHLVQLVGILFIFSGIRRELADRNPRTIP